MKMLFQDFFLTHQLRAILGMVNSTFNITLVQNWFYLEKL